MSSYKDIRELVREIVIEAVTFNNNKTFTPPPNVSMKAKESLYAVNKNNLLIKGTNSGSGISKANDLVSKKIQNFDMMRRMKSFFDKHEEEYKSEIRKGKTINNSSLIQSWNLHGGDVGAAWVRQELSSLNSSNLNTKKNLRKAGGAGTNKGMGIFDTKVMSTNNHRIHR